MKHVAVGGNPTGPPKKEGGRLAWLRNIFYRDPQGWKNNPGGTSG